MKLERTASGNHETAAIASSSIMNSRFGQCSIVENVCSLSRQTESMYKCQILGGQSCCTGALGARTLSRCLTYPGTVVVLSTIDEIILVVLAYLTLRGGTILRLLQCEMAVTIASKEVERCISISECVSGETEL